MRRTFALAAGVLLLAGCTPNAVIEFLYPKCKQQKTSCEDEKRNKNRNQDPPWDTDTSHWSGHIGRFIPAKDTSFVPRDRDTTLTPGSGRGQIIPTPPR